MTRLFAAAVLLSIAAVPAFACDWNQSAASDDHTSTVASQPTDNTQTPPPPATPADQKPS